MTELVKSKKRKRPDKESVHVSSPKAKRKKSLEEDIPVSTEHMEMLDSVVGHMKELSNIENTVPKDETKTKKKKKHKSDKTDKIVVGKEAAMEYLRLWSKEREKWSFKKKTQYWLLQHMYIKKEVSKMNFKVLLDYLEGLAGHQREIVIHRAQEILENYNEDETEGTPTRHRYKRAVAILRVLA